MKHAEILEKMQITEKELSRITSWLEDNRNVESDIGFEHEETGQWITNIFIDTSGRFPKTLEESVKIFGFENVNDFCHKVLDRINKGARNI